MGGSENAQDEVCAGAHQFDGACVRTGGAQKKIELLLNLLVMSDYSNRRAPRMLAQRTKIDINKHSFSAALAEYRANAKIAGENTTARDGAALPVDRRFQTRRRGQQGSEGYSRQRKLNASNPCLFGAWFRHPRSARQSPKRAAVLPTPDSPDTHT